MNCSECDGTIPKGPPIYKNFAKGYTMLWAFPLCKPCYLKTILEPRWGKDFVKKYSPKWYE